ncbi:MAG: signal peptide peptidase SppA [Bacteroidota bacterium]
MKTFFKIFFASLLALIVFTVIGLFILIGFISTATTSQVPVVGSKAVLVLDLSVNLKEQAVEDPFGELISSVEANKPSLFDVVRLIGEAKSDSAVKGIYILASDNANGFSSSEELRKAVLDFKKSGKFVIAYGETMTQKAYYVASAAERVYVHPQGGLEWSGFSSNLFFLKGMLDKLQIEPQIFYAGKFKSATEPLRETKMTEANRLQTAVWLGDLYSVFLKAASTARKIDTAVLHQLANDGDIQTAVDAEKYQLVDGLKYDDEVKGEILKRLKKGSGSSINFVTINEYAAATTLNDFSGTGKIAIIYAQGDIVSQEGDEEQVSSDLYKNVIRKARLDKDIKAIVLRVNSPGGSALASDVIWREISLARKEKPVVVSMGDVAASGGYYIACNADAVFANETSITGSIGVFSIVPNFESFLKNKLGITTDRVRTAPYADMGAGDRPLTATEKRFFQAATDSIYHTFKKRVAEGRERNIEYIDSIAQGRVWTGKRALEAGLVDKIGTLQDAVKHAARLAKIEDNYRLREYPEKKNLFEQIMGNYKRSIKTNLIKDEIGMEQWQLMQQFKQVKQMVGEPQARMPYFLTIH